MSYVHTLRSESPSWCKREGRQPRAVRRPSSFFPPGFLQDLDVERLVGDEPPTGSRRRNVRLLLSVLCPLGRLLLL